MAASSNERSGKSDLLPPRTTNKVERGPGIRLNEGGFFNLDKYEVRHDLYIGGMSDKKTVEVFERGDAVGVVLYNRDRKKVVVVEQFRLPTFELGGGSGWLIETVAGMIGTVEENGTVRNETAEETAIRETYEEAGYDITKPEPIATFFSSPGGTSERIFLFFAMVTDEDKTGPGGGTKGEDIKVVEYDIDTFRAMLKAQEFHDPKLLVATYYLQARLGLKIETGERLTPDAEPVFFAWKREPKCQIRFKTGDILEVRNVDVWLNTENKYMMMDRVIDASISASIRWGGAIKYGNGSVAVDTIGNDLRRKLKGRPEASDYEIIETETGCLGTKWDNGVKRLLHLPIAEAKGDHKAREGVRANPDKIRKTVFEALKYVDHANQKLSLRIQSTFGLDRPCRSVLIPLIGTGDGGLTANESIPQIIAGIVQFFEENSKTTEVVEVSILTLFKNDLDICKEELRGHNQFTEITPSVIPAHS